MTSELLQDKLLEISDLEVTFRADTGEVQAVRGLCFDLYRGETLGIVGESGSGKSVTGLSLMRLLPSTGVEVKGMIRFYHASGEAIDLLQLPESEMRQYRGNELAMIFQEPMTSLNPVLRCGEQVAEAIRLHRKLDTRAAKSEVLSWFEKVKLPEPKRMYEAYPHQLSGGQKQRVMIAMALSCEPAALLADEPTTALDVSVQKSILDLLRDLQAELGIAIVFISHDLGVIAEIADRVLVMQQGQIVEEGKVANVFQHAQHPYTQGLLACRPALDYRLRRLPLVRDFLEHGATNFKDKIEHLKISPLDSADRLKHLQMQTPILKVEGVKVWFPVQKNIWGKPKDYVKAVDGVSFDVYPGETLGLVGESGCGKTTLGRAILRLTEPTAGQVYFDGHNLSACSDQEMQGLRQQLQIIFQDPYSSLNPRLTIGEAIIEPMRVHQTGHNEAERRDRAIDLLQTVGMEAVHLQRYPHEFSGGQRQRICIARALALEPRFIICDEMVSALDVSVQAQVLNLLLELRELYQLTYIFISHDLSVVKQMSDRMLVMNAGKIEAYGPADAIYANPQSDYTRKLIAAIPKGQRVLNG